MQTFAHNKNVCLEIIDIFSINVPILWQEWWEFWTKCQSARISSVIYYTCLDTGLQMFTRGQMNNQDVDSLSKIFVAKYRILTDGRPPSFVKGICILLWKRKWNRIMIHFSDSDMFGWRREQIAASGIEGNWGGGRGGEDEIMQNLGKKNPEKGLSVTEEIIVIHIGSDLLESNDCWCWCTTREDLPNECSANSSWVEGMDS